MAVIARNTDEVSTPTSILLKRDHDQFACQSDWMVAKKGRYKIPPNGSGSFQPFIFSNSFFYLSSTEPQRNTSNIISNKINTERESNNIKCNGHHLGFCQRTVAADERTGSETCCKDADFHTAHRHPQSRSYVSDKTNDLQSKMEIRCTYHSRCRSSNFNSGNSLNKTRQHCKMRSVGDESVPFSFPKSGFPATSPRLSHPCSETSNQHLSKLFSSSWTCRCERRKNATRSTSNNRLLSNSYLSIILTFILLLTTTDLVAGRRQHHRRGSGPRSTRDSGFHRGATRSAFSSQKCEDITVPLCKDIGYNKTDMSLSLMNKFTQAEAKTDLDLFNPLLKVNCSAEMKLFLCSIYTPICMNGYRLFLPPCRFICESAKRGCLPFMQKYNYDWPKNLRCERFPRYINKRSMCMHFNLTKPQEELKRPRTDVTTVSRIKAKGRKTNTSTLPTTTPLSTKPKAKPSVSSVAPSLQNTTCTLECREPMVKIINRDDPLYNKVSTGNILNCAIPCKSPYFTENEITMAENTIKWFSIVCFVVTLLTVATYLIDMDRFEYPQRPIIFMSVCYLFVSIGFLIRIVAGHAAVGCDYNTGHVLYHSTGPALCVTVFMLTYFFSMASAICMTVAFTEIWWVILSMTWFLAAALKWGNEAIAKYFQVYHIVAWIFPSILTILLKIGLSAVMFQFVKFLIFMRICHQFLILLMSFRRNNIEVLVLSCVDGDSFSGICFVGNQDVQNLRGFVLFPFVICFAGGGLFLLVGFISLIRIWSRVRKDGKKTDKFERLIIRIGFFNVLYMLSAAILVGCYFYEQENRSSWEVSHNCPADSNTHKPSFPILMARHLMTLVIGITNGVWISTSKTLESWKGFYRRCMCSLYNASCSPPCGKSFDKVNVSVDKNANEGVTTNDKWSCRSSTRRQSDKHYQGSLNNRNDSYHSRHSSVNQESEYVSRSKGSRNSSASRNTISRQDSCVYCSQSPRTSTNHIESAEPTRKRKKKRSRRPSESFLQATRRKRNGGAQGDEACQILCSSNTTSTDGSDRLAQDSENRVPNVQPETIAPQNPHQNTYLCQYSAASHQSSLTMPFERAESPLSIEHCESCLDISGKYVINCDNLPPPIPRPCAAGHSCISSCSHSQCCDGGTNSVTSICKNDPANEMSPSLLCDESELMYHCKEDSQSYYHHFQQHHCQGKILS